MQKKFISAVGATVIMALATVGCGDDTAEEGSPATNVTLPSQSADYAYPTGDDDFVLAYSELGGFVTREVAFQRAPSIVVSGDGRVFTPGAQIAIYPGPLLPAIDVRTISEVGIQRLLAAADEAGLLADVEYDDVDNIADASTASVTINAEGQPWVHEAYALAIGRGPGELNASNSPEREQLSDFLASLSDLSQLVGADELGQSESYQSAEYAIEAVVVTDPADFANSGIDPTIVAWPADATTRLADAQQCVLISADEFRSVLESANQLTFFSDDDVTYQVLVKLVFPGSNCTL